MISTGEAVGAVGLALTVIALWLAKRQMTMANEQAEDLEKITSSMSTQFIGHFPHFNSEIATLLAKANSRIDIFCDLPAYGLISNLKAWHRIDEAIRTKINNGIEVSLHVYGPARRKRILDEQRAHRSYLEGNETLQGAIQKVLHDIGDDRTVADLTEEEIVDACLKRHKRVIEETFRGAVVTPIQHHIPIYCWIVDEREAIYSVPIFAGDSTEYGFSTKDGKFVSALLQMSDRFRTQAR